MDKPEQPQNAGATSSSALTSKPWLATFITLLGSSGLISVVGPVVGELYWEGYLQAFGLQPEEFPASSARVAVYAYEALLAGALAVGRDLWGLRWWGLGALLAICIAAVLLQETPAHSRTTRLRQRLVDALQDRSAVGVSLRMTTVVLAVFASLTVVAYFALAALVMFVLPIKARTFGLDQGRSALTRALAAAENPAKCDRVQSAMLPAGCQWVVAFTDKQVAVFVSGRTYRVPRRRDRHRLGCRAAGRCLYCEDGGGGEQEMTHGGGAPADGRSGVGSAGARPFYAISRQGRPTATTPNR